MMILCMGLLKAIRTICTKRRQWMAPARSRTSLKLPSRCWIKPLTPLMIASFAFNFNNFVLIQLLTNGGPDRLGTPPPAPVMTDLLVSYTYRIAFEGGGG